MSRHVTRRQFVQTVSAAALACHSATPRRSLADEAKSPANRLRVACIGTGGRGRAIAKDISNYGDILAVCDVDRKHAEQCSKERTEGKAPIFQDYREVLDRGKYDAVTIGTPDHWHTKIAVEALRAGLDVYCEKPLTLTVAEGQLICDTVKKTGRVFQVGTQQRSSANLFQTAIALVQSGRLGKISRVTCAIGGAPRGGPFPKTTSPDELDWNRWLGPTPEVAYIAQRCHANFRWWFEYSGGKMTDWGAHHVDIAQWGIGMEESGPSTVEVVSAELPVEFEKGWPKADDCYNTAVTFKVRCQFPNGVEMFIRDRAEDLGFDNGIMFEGENGRLFVNRGKITGKLVDELKENPLDEALFTRLRKGKGALPHMGNFVACVKDRSLPISDVFTHHRNLTTCHLANIAIRLGRRLRWDAQAEKFVDDAEANSFLARPSRKGFEIEG